jgi:Tol biopolymer transport system component
MGEVYEARDEHLDRSIALKILPPELVQNDDRVRRFVQEAKSASGLNHPNIVTIYDIGHTEPSQSQEGGETESAGPVHFIAMELVRGRTLRDKIHHEQAPLKELLRWLAQSAEGMAKAHAAGIVHRDLKPENIMISNDGFAKILDFGLAKLTERKVSGEGVGSVAATDVRHKTREGTVLGTVGYMAPEQVQGKVVDERSDIFSFGCILYEATTRQRPFDADSDIETMHQIITAQPTAVIEVNPDAPSELRKLIRRCLAKDPDKRYQSMKDLSLELFDLVEEFDQLSVSAASRSSGSGDAAPIVSARSRWILPGAIALAGLALAAAVYFALRPRTAAAPAATGALNAKFTQLTDLGGLEDQPSLSPDGLYVAYAADPAPDVPRSDIFLLRVGGRNPINLTQGSPDNDEMPAFSPDGQWIAFRSGRGGGGIYLMGATGESVRRIADFGYNPSWSPNGKQIVVSTEGGNNPRGRTTTAQLWIVDVQGGAKKKIFDGDAVQPQWSPDGKRIAFWSLPYSQRGQRDISTIPAEGGKPVQITDDPALDWSPAWSGDGKTLFFASDRGGSMNLWRVPIDPSTGAAAGAAQALTTPSSWSGEISVARAAPRIVFASLAGEINIHKLAFEPAGAIASSSDTAVTTGTTLFLEADPSPDGSQVATRSWSGQEDIYLVRPDGTGLRKVTDDPAKDRGPRWSPDGKQIAFYSDRSGRYEIWVIDPEGGNLRQVTKTEGRSLWFPTWSPDGKKVAVSNEQRATIFDLTQPWPVTKGEPLAPMAEGLVMEVSDWSPDGRYLVGFSRKGAEEWNGLWVYSVESRSYEKITDTGSSYPSRPAWLADSRRFVFAHDGKLWVADRVTRESKPIYEPLGYFLQTPRVSRDQRTIFFMKSRDEGDIWMATLE